MSSSAASSKWAAIFAALAFTFTAASWAAAPSTAAEREPNEPGRQRNEHVYGVSDPCPWSEMVSRQLSLPERPDFRDFVESQGFSLS